MKQNKRGFTLLYSLMLGVLLFIVGLAVAPALNSTVTEYSSTSELNCTNASSLTNQDKSVCTAMDVQQLYLAVILGIAGIVIGGIAIR